MGRPQATRPAWKEPMVWLVAAIPAASVVASVALLVSAARSSGNNDAVTDRVQRTAQIQVTDRETTDMTARVRALAPDLAARELRLAATVTIEGERISLHADRGDFPRDAELRLALRHPLRAEEDFDLVLRPTAGVWQAIHALPPGSDWNLTLSPADGHWRLQGRLQHDTRKATLQPALAAP